MESIINLIKRPAFILKMVELLLGFTASMLIAGEVAASTNLSGYATIYVTLMGFILINLIVIVSYVLDTPLHKFLLLGISVVGAILFLTSGSLMIDYYVHYSGSDNLAASGSLTLINFIVYVIDTGLTFEGMV